MSPASRGRLLLFTLGGGLVGAALVGLLVGPHPVEAPSILRWLGGDRDALDEVSAAVVGSIRLPRVVAGVVVGSLLGACGAAVQGLLRNALADPGLTGVTAGASVGALVYLVTGGGGWLGFRLVVDFDLGLPLAAFAGGLGATLLLLTLSGAAAAVSALPLLLGGIAINAAAGAAIGLLLFHADDAQLRDFTFWSLGGLGRATWPGLLAATPFALLTAILLTRSRQALDALALGEAGAGHLGIDVPALRRTVVLAAAAGVGAAVALAGGIGFIGLVVPHLIRLLVGPAHGVLLPASALAGAILLLAADAAARTIGAPAELPVGVLTAAIGAPVLFTLLRSRASAL